MSTTEAFVPPGHYHIVVASHGRFIHERLTDHGQHVTITPPSANADPSQVWQVSEGRRDGTIVIQRPGNIRPALSLTYKSSGHPKGGDRLMLRREEFSTEWKLDIAPGFRYYIRVPGESLGIAVAPERIHPPFLEIDHKDQLEWVFERVIKHGLEEEDRAA